MKIQARKVETLNDVDPAVVAACRENGIIDASETLVLGRQMEIIKAAILEKKYPDRLGRSLVPKSPDGDNASQYLVVRYMDEYTTCQIVSDYATDFPNVAMSMSESFAKYFSLGNSFIYSIQELREAAKAGIGIVNRLADLARLGIEQGIDDIIFRGVPQNGTYGLMNNPNVPLLSLPNGDWPDATFAEVVEDLMFLSTAIPAQTMDIFGHSNMVLVLDDLSYNIAATKIGGMNSDRSALQVFLSQAPDGFTVVKSTKLRTIGSGSGPRAIVYQRDPQVLQLEIGQEFEMFEGERKAMVITTACHARVAGVSFYHPMAAAYFENHRNS